MEKVGRPRIWKGYKIENRQWHYTACSTCGKPLAIRTSVIHNSHHKNMSSFYCSRECYRKSLNLKKHGRSLWFRYGHIALIHLWNLRAEASNLGIKAENWCETTKEWLIKEIEKIKRFIYEKKHQLTIDYEYGPKPAFIESEYNSGIPPPKNKINNNIFTINKKEAKACPACGDKMVLFRNQWHCECTYYEPV